MEPGCAANSSQPGCERHSHSIGLKSSPCSGRKYRSHGWRPENCVLLDGGSQRTQPDAQVPRQRRAGIALHHKGSTAIGPDSCTGNPWKTSFLEEVQTEFLKSSVFSADVRQVISAGAAEVTTGDMPRPDTNGGSQERTRRLGEPAIVGGCRGFGMKNRSSA